MEARKELYSFPKKKNFNLFIERKSYQSFLKIGLGDLKLDNIKYK